MENLVSILTTTYNHQAYIDECVKSAMDQSYATWEMIIIDDGSTDNTLNIANKYAEIDSRIRVLTQQNNGIFRLSETYNKGLALSHGRYIAILEGDDFWTPEKLKIQMEFLDANPDVVVCWGKAKSISSDKKTVFRTYPINDLNEIKYYNNEPVGMILQLLLYKNVIPAVTLLIKKEALIRIGGFASFENMPTTDLPTLLKLALIGRFGYIDRNLAYWRTYSGQTTKLYPALLSEGYYNLVMNFLNTNYENKILSKINKENINTYHKKQLIIAYSRSGRYRLIRKEFSQARQDYYKSLLKGGLKCPLWKIRSIIGIVFSFFHLNVESLSSLLGKKSYSNA